MLEGTNALHAVPLMSPESIQNQRISTTVKTSKLLSFAILSKKMPVSKAADIEALVVGEQTENPYLSVINKKLRSTKKK